MTDTEKIEALLERLSGWGEDNGDGQPRTLLSETASTIRALSAENERMRKVVAKLHCSSGCSCCRDDEGWSAASDELGKMLNIPRYDDDSGWDFYSVHEQALKEADTTRAIEKES